MLNNKESFPNGSTRRAGREFSFQYLYHFQFQCAEDVKTTILAETDDSALTMDLNSFMGSLPIELEEHVLFFSKKLIKGALDNYNSINEVIESNSKSWALSRINKTDHTVLLQALYEMTYLEETPHNVIINESVDIAKKYGTEESKGFINGMLDNISKNHAKS